MKKEFMTNHTAQSITAHRAEDKHLWHCRAASHLLPSSKAVQRPSK